MPRVARRGDRGTKGLIEPLAASHENCSDGQTTAKVGDVYLCDKHSSPAGSPHRIKNGCQFFKIDDKPVAMQYASLSSCGCRIIEGSDIHYCCPHLDAKAKRLAEREMLIEEVREAIASGRIAPRDAHAARHHADALERLNRDVRFAEMSVAVYQSPDAPAHLSTGFGNAPEGMIRLTDAEFRELMPEPLGDAGLVWDDNDAGFHADLYYDELSGSYTIAYRGTEPELNDAITDHDQAHGLETKQYNQAMDIGSVINEMRTNDPATDIDLRATGHSLGGGLASAGGTVGGIPYITFNAAGLHPATVARYTDGKLGNEDAAPLGRAYNTDHDPLTLAQTWGGSRLLYGITNTVANNSGVLRPILSTYVMWSAGRTGGVLPPTPAATRHVLTTMSERTSPEPEAAWRHRENSILSRYPQRNPTGGYIQPPYTDTHTRRAGLSGLKVGHSSIVILDSIEAEKTHHLEVLRHVLPA